MGTKQLCLVMSLMLTMASAAHAQASDNTLQALMADALDVDVAANLEGTTAGENRLQIYIGSKSDKLLLRDITLWFDDQAPIRYEYSDPESQALQKGALHSLILPGLQQGMHKLRADFHVSDSTAKPGGPSAHGQFNKSFLSDGPTSALELHLIQGGFLSETSLELSNFDTTTTRVIDERIHATDFLVADRRYFSVVSALMQLLTQNPGAQTDEAINRRLSASLHGMGLADRAAVIDAALATQHAGVAGQGTNGDDSQINRYNQALALIQQGKDLDGAAELDAIGHSDFEDPAALTLRDHANLVLGYYYLDHHKAAAAVPVFSRVRSPGPCANPALLGLGWALLAPSGPADVSSEITAQRFPTLVTPQLTADIVAQRREQPPNVPIATEDQRRILSRALVPWTELIGRDPTDNAVQEGMLAIAWTLYHFGAYEQAADDYIRAVDQFEKIRGWFNAAIQHVRNGGMIAAITAHNVDKSSGWHWSNVDLLPVRAHWWFGDTPDTPRDVASTFYLDHLLLNDDFARELHNYNELRLIADTIDRDLGGLQAEDASTSLRKRLSTLRPRISSAITLQRKRLDEIAVVDLDLQKKQLERYLIEARYALASIYDRAEVAGNP